MSTNDDVAEQSKIAHLNSNETNMLLLLQHIEDRIDDGYAKCPTCGDSDRANKTRMRVDGRKWNAVRHYNGCPFAAFMAQSA
jgi:hypothetical protein